MAKVFCYPKLGRAGLGNCMLPWARAVVYARKNSCPLLAPGWVQPRFGAVLRREKVKRFYLNEFTNRGYVAGLRKWWILKRANKVGENEAIKRMPEKGDAGSRPTVITFEGLKNYFRDIWYDYDIVREELFKIVSPPILKKVSQMDGPFIAMHVRRGDIITPGFSEEQLMSKKHYTPLSWFVAAAKAVANDPAWCGLPIYVVSDGREMELAELLRLANCRLVTLGSAIGDISLLSKAKMLFVTGHSTFGMWGSYLGRIPALYYPGKMDQNIFPPENYIFEGEWNPQQSLPQISR